MDQDDNSPTLYERYFLDGQYANWRMSTKYANVNPKTHFLIAIGLLFGTMLIMLALAPLGMCYLAPLASWESACKFGGSIIVTSSKEIQISKDNCDTLYDKGDWQKAPKIAWPNAVQNRKYTVFVLDPDAPNHPNGTYYLHMLQTNVKGEDLQVGNFKKSLTLAPYVGPAPPEGTGIHRYMFVIYQHCMPPDNLPSMEISSRIKFDLEKWLNFLPLKMLGPLVGVQFRAGY